MLQLHVEFEDPAPLTAMRPSEVSDRNCKLGFFPQFLSHEHRLDGNVLDKLEWIFCNLGYIATRAILALGLGKRKADPVIWENEIRVGPREYYGLSLKLESDERFTWETCDFTRRLIDQMPRS